MKFTRQSKAFFDEYIKAAEGARNDLEFLLDHVGEPIELDASEDCFAKLEALYWRFRADPELLRGLGSAEEFIGLIARYLGQTVVERCGARWVQSKERSDEFGLPVVDGFGNEDWDQICPIKIARACPTIAHTNPYMRGARERRVFAELLKKALKIYNAAK